MLQTSQRSPFSGRARVGPPSVRFAYRLRADKNDTLTLQVDKCVLTTLGEISTWSAGSLPGTHFYLHLLRLAEETLNLLHDLWLQFGNPPPCTRLFGCHPDFSSFCFVVVLCSHWLSWAISPPPLSSSALHRTLGACVTVTDLCTGEGTSPWWTPRRFLFWLQSESQKERKSKVVIWFW